MTEKTGPKKLLHIEGNEAGRKSTQFLFDSTEDPALALTTTGSIGEGIEIIREDSSDVLRIRGAESARELAEALGDTEIAEALQGIQRIIVSSGYVGSSAEDTVLRASQKLCDKCQETLSATVHLVDVLKETEFWTLMLEGKVEDALKLVTDIDQDKP